MLKQTALSFALACFALHAQSTLNTHVSSPVDRKVVGDSPSDPGPLAADLSPEITRKAIRAAILKVGTWQLRASDSLPVRSPGLLCCGVACNKPEYVAQWRTMNPDPNDPEIVRNYPIRQPLLWYAA